MSFIKINRTFVRVEDILDIEIHAAVKRVYQSGQVSDHYERVFSWQSFKMTDLVPEISVTLRSITFDGDASVNKELRVQGNASVNLMRQIGIDTQGLLDYVNELSSIFKERGDLK